MIEIIKLYLRNSNKYYLSVRIFEMRLDVRYFVFDFYAQGEDPIHTKRSPVGRGW